MWFHVWNCLRILLLFHFYVAGIDKWIQLTPISKDDDVQGEVLVEMSMEPATESEVQCSWSTQPISQSHLSGGWEMGWLDSVSSTQTISHSHLSGGWEMGWLDSVSSTQTISHSHLSGGWEMGWLDRLRYRYSWMSWGSALHLELFYVTSSPLRMEKKMENCHHVGEQGDGSFCGNLDEWILIMLLVYVELDKTPLLCE